jgi:hypothetical protein
MDNLFCDTLSLLVCGDLPREGKRGALQQVLQHRYLLTPG